MRVSEWVEEEEILRNKQTNKQNWPNRGPELIRVPWALACISPSFELPRTASWEHLASGIVML